MPTTLETKTYRCKTAQTGLNIFNISLLSWKKYFKVCRHLSSFVLTVTHNFINPIFWLPEVGSVKHLFIYLLFKFFKGQNRV